MSTPARPAPPWPGHAAPQRFAPAPRAGRATAALVLGIFSLATCWVLLLNVLAAVAGLVGLVLGILALRASRRTGAGHDRALAGTVLSGLGILTTALVLVIVQTVLVPRLLHLVDNTSVAGQDGRAVGPMADDVRVTECYGAGALAQVASVSVTNSTDAPRSYRITVTAYEGGEVVGTLDASSGEIAPGASEVIAVQGLVLAPPDVCVVSQVSRL